MTAGALRVIDGGGAAPRGWGALWAKDEWRQRELPHGDLAITYDRQVVLRFGGLAQPWLKEAAKCWARTRLLGSLSPRSMERYLRELMEFSRWLADRDVASPGAITRELLEDYLLYVRTRPWAQSTRRRRLGALRAFLEEQRDDGLAGLPRTAVIHFTEMPRVGFRPPKGLDKRLFDQLINPKNLALLGSEQHRTLILLLAHTGLRVSSLVLLRRDALQVGSDGHPYLRFQNVKLSREAVIPIAPALAEQLRRHEEYLRRVYPDGTDWLLPSPPARGAPGMGRGGRFHITPGSVNELLRSYVRKANIRDRDGHLATWIHAHAFRHHLGTSMVNDGVPLPVIQRLFDHASITMTAHYAQLHDETLRREITRWHERVNIRGERIALPLDGPLEEAAWMKERIARAKQALPNGYCGLSLVQTCPHPNACLSCDNFLTDGSFRTVHEQQLEHTRELRERAQQTGSLRLVEVLERDERSLTRILQGLDDIDQGHERDAAAPLDVVQLAAARRRGGRGGS
jgi:site-specific recombinase XerD